MKKIKLSEIFPNPENPRIIKDEKFKKLVNSIKEFPKMMELRPIIIDSNGMILAGNMRYKALQELKYKDVPETWVKAADTLTEEEKRRFTITDNNSFGEWDIDMIANNYDITDLDAWGFDLPSLSINEDDFDDKFSLKDGDKSPFQQITFTLADKQAEQIKNAIADIKKTEEYKYVETMGNENSNGNALYLIISQWEGQRK